GGSTFRFARTEPLSTYQFAFAAGRFRIEEAERDGRRMRMFHRETDSAKLARNREAIFDLHAKALAWLEDYTGIPYPFGKFDFVLVPSFQYGGMEHPGAIYYRAAGLLLDESATQNQKLGRASVISHETTHMWFGDLVTMRWFDDVWMKEVFANFMAAKIVNPSFPEIDHDLRFLLAHYPAAYAVDRTDGANPIRQELDNLKDAGTLYGAIIYQKAPIVMKHLELLVGQDAFRDGLREYLRAHAYGNASWPDLIDLLDRRSDEDLRGWSHAWVEEPGRPTVEVEELPEAGGAARKAGTGASDGGAPEAGASDGGVSRGAASGAGRVLRIALRERDPRGRGLVWTQPLTVLVVERAPDGGEVWQSFPLRLAGDTTLSVTLGAGGEAVILANGAGVGYGRFELTPGSREELLAHLPEVDAPVPRAVAWLSLWDEMLEGGVAPERIVDLAMRDLAVERDELIVSQVLGDLGTAYWRFLPPERRAALAPRLEALLWSRLEAAEAASLKSSFFRGYEAVALSGEAVERLARVWRGERKIPGLPLSERDYTRLALQLAVREAPGWRGILAGQSVRIRNPDRRARFEFVRPALDAAPEVREAFFRSLKDLANRAHEPWVLEALSYLHHPLRAESSLRDIRPSLEWLEEIQRTGDIFFPKRWLDATLGGHSSPEAAGIVRDFLDGHPDYPPRLRAKILQSADLLFRAARARSAGP
ncbi:MAG: M1 family aminopeptidase, partial [Gemmatimonadota bacterium]